VATSGPCSGMPNPHYSEMQIPTIARNHISIKPPHLMPRRLSRKTCGSV
jgi:hypothetical protein